MRGESVKTSGQETLTEALVVATGLDPGVSTGIGRREHLGLGNRPTLVGRGRHQG